MVSTPRSYLDLFLDSLNYVYLGLWGTYFVIMYLWYWYGLLGDLVGWFRGTFGILAFNLEAVPGGPELTISRTLTFFDWVYRTITRDFVSLSLLSAIVFVVQKRRRRKRKTS
jgi:hypothetical protein